MSAVDGRRCTVKVYQDGSRSLNQCWNFWAYWNLLSHASFGVYRFFNLYYMVGCLHENMSFDMYYVDAEALYNA